MPRNFLAVSLLAGALLAADPASAGQVVEFTDGRYLEIVRHEPIEDFIRLDLGSGSFLVIPQSQIDTIREGRQDVFTPSGRLTDVPPRRTVPVAPATSEASTFVVEAGASLPQRRGNAG